jgi:redox-sensitive bicupin YhaK (pirin superfamily)
MKKVLGIYSNLDVRRMTAAGGILHEQFHSPAFTWNGGPFLMVQRVSKAPSSQRRAGG